MITNTEKFINWNRPYVTKASYPGNWSVDQLQVEWQQIVQTNEVDPNDEWDISATEIKHQLSELHRQWGVPDDAVMHYMSFRPELTNGFEELIKPFENFTYHYNLLKLTAGHMITWHCDAYSTFVKFNNVSDQELEKIKRTAIFLSPWGFGHVLQVGSEVFSHWNPGDAFTWENYAWHGACNFGRDDMIILQVTYIEK